MKSFGGDWRSEALCKGKHVDLWFPPLEADSPELYYSISRLICRQCPVWERCLKDGKEEKHGMWGGLTPQERTVFITDTPKKSAVRAHGTWVRFRQGCSCDECAQAHETVIDKIDVEKIPKMTDNLTDIETLKFTLIPATDG